MKDPNDHSTLDIISTQFPETVKPKRGRPSKGPEALSSREKNKAYKERQAKLGRRPRTLWLSDREAQIISRWLTASRGD